MKVALCAAHQQICAQYFRIAAGARVALSHDLYDVGTLMYYAPYEAYYLWTKYRTGLFAMHTESDQEHLGFVLLVEGEVKRFFNVFSYAVISPASPPSLAPFYVDAAFNNDGVGAIFSCSTGKIRRRQ